MTSQLWRAAALHFAVGLRERSGRDKIAKLYFCFPGILYAAVFIIYIRLLFGVTITSLVANKLFHTVGP